MVKRQKWTRIGRVMEWFGRIRSEQRHRRELARQQERNAQRATLYAPYKGKRRTLGIFQ